jgi:hypothetical protein
MKRFIPALFLMLLLPWSNAVGQEVSVEKVWFGEYSIGATKEIIDPKSPTGKRYESEGKATLSLQTDTIKLRKDMKFGFGYVVHGPRGTIDIEHVYFLPDDSGVTSADREPSFRDIDPSVAGETSFIGWNISDKADVERIKTGTYIFQIRYQSRILAEHRFNVTR